MTDLPDREPISDEEVDAEVDGVVDGHRPAVPDLMIRPPLRFFTADRRVVVAVCVMGAAFSLLALVAIVSLIRVIIDQGDTINTERSRSRQIEVQLEEQKTVQADTAEQARCRAQVANDYEAVKTTFDLTVSHRDQVFREALSVILKGDREGFQAKLDEAAAIDPAIAELEPQVQQAAIARRDSVDTCQQSAAIQAAAAKAAQPGR